MHAPIVRWRDGNTDNDLEDEGDSTLYYCTDANFNVTALVNASGTVVERYLYDPYGKVTVCDGSWTPREGNASAYSNEVLFTGHRLDPESGLYYTLWRPYHCTLGDWVGRDPKGYVDGMGLYTYARSKPCDFTDPQGLKITLDEPQPVEYKGKDTEEYKVALRAKAQVERTIADAANGKKRASIERQIENAKNDGKAQLAKGLERQLATLELINWAKETGDVDITVKFVPKIEGSSAVANIDTTDLETPDRKNNTATMTIVTQGAGLPSNISTAFFHETLHAYYAVESGKGGFIYHPPAMDAFKDELKKYDIDNVPLGRELPLDSETSKFITDRQNGKYKGQQLRTDPLLYKVTGGFEKVVGDVEQTYAAPYYKSRTFEDAGGGNR